MTTKLDRAFWWLENGFSLLPCQPGAKHLVKGFGQYASKITDQRTAGAWFGLGTKTNMAVLAPDGMYILDFDKIEVYAAWAEKCPASSSYTESTPRGGRHVFLRGEVPPGVKLIPGAELKKICLVSPSAIDQQNYKITIEHPFYGLDPISVLSPLSLPGHATPRFLQVDEIRTQGQTYTKIAQIKQHWKISNVLLTYRPDTKFIGRGNWLSCKCPLHQDSKPSFGFNDSKGFWVCHACDIRGDVINLYSRLQDVSLLEAIKRMWDVMP